MFVIYEIYLILTWQIRGRTLIVRLNCMTVNTCALYVEVPWLSGICLPACLVVASRCGNVDTFILNKLSDPHSSLLYQILAQV